MASAVLSNRNEPNWPQHRSSGAGFMGKTPFANSNPNPNSKPKLGNSKRTQSASDDASSINRRTNEVNHHSQHVTFNVASYSKNELNELKHRLVSELEQIRNLKNRIESGEFQPPRKSMNKKISGNKRPVPKDFKRSNSEIEGLMKGCGQVLQKLMKNKHAFHFNAPVDVVGMNLHDYHDIIKRPMDLGTVKSNLSKKVYATPAEFASDVRLAFNNALTYNPEGHSVNTAAEQLLARFEQLYRPLHEKYEECLKQVHHFEEELQASSWNHVEPPERVKKKRENPNPIPVPPVEYQHPEPPQPLASSSKPPVEQPQVEQQRPLMQSPARPLMQSPARTRTPSPMQATPVKPLKQPKPKARDPNKRDMNLEEKQKLGMGLQSLPPEKMEQVVQIIRKRNGHLEQDGDEIELDIEAVDTETLWELDRLVTNWKKAMSKIKRQALMGNVNNNGTSNNDNVEVPASEKVDEVSPVEAKKPKKAEAGDEDVDIGDDMPMSVFPPVEIEKDKDVVVGGYASSSSSSSSSSGSDSSSSSDSDSGSSSGSDSEADNGHL
ncbi:transcription factor GTE7-like [Vicia villosa]|uniref:transcription factor GTE7-like n=1 Tax=Vicia villosa TaxID=3911 RepID=UPI00273BCF04|nr:transcription factor GTE7-like [Vicia villosa]